MLLDDFMPRFDVAKRHETLIDAPRERVYDSILTADLASHPVVQMLLFLRGMGRRTRSSLKFHEGFELAAADRPNEIVIGLEGPFWKPACRPNGVDAKRFRDPLVPGTARAGWNFSTEESNGRTRLRTETRVLCADASARGRFRAYWFFVGPFSGLIRRFMLAAIKREAETR
jgi:hypothetical protein